MTQDFEYPLIENPAGEHSVEPSRPAADRTPPIRGERPQQELEGCGDQVLSCLLFAARPPHRRSIALVLLKMI
jgi:hypothetical protein